MAKRRRRACECGRRIKHDYLGMCDRCAFLDHGRLPGRSPGRIAVQCEIIAALREQGSGMSIAQLLLEVPGRRSYESMLGSLRSLQRKGRVVMRREFADDDDAIRDRMRGIPSNRWYLVTPAGEDT